MTDFDCCDDHVVDQTQYPGGDSCGCSGWQNRDSVDALGHCQWQGSC